MSTIDKLSIRGIRSFGTQQEDEQKIVFSTPVTLIVGENGCGKTTIIECLKFALTGDTPPGSDAGKTFVHDPKVLKTSHSLGQVRLKVTDTAGRSKTCIRSLRTDLLKTGKLKFQTIDSTMITEDHKGRREEAGQRVEDVNIQMSAAMGVSKAILNNVIFCHQEDSNWPLDESKKLKEKFDTIFGTTEYNKAIDKIFKFRKSYQEKLSSCVQGKRFRLEMKDDADRKLLELEMLRKKQEEMKKKVAECDELLAPIETLMEVLLTKERKFGQLHAEKLGFQAQIDNCKSNSENIRKKIRNLLDQDVDALEEQLSSFNKNQKANEKNLEKLNLEQHELVKCEKQLNDNVAKTQSKKDLMANHIGTMQDLIGSRANAVKALAKKLDIKLSVDIDTQSLTANDFGSALVQIKHGFNDKENELRKLKSLEDKRDQELQKEIDEVREEKSTVETTISNHRNQLEKLHNDRSLNEGEIKEIESSMPTFDRLLKQINEATQEMGKLQSDNNIDCLEKERIVLEVEKEEQEKNFSSLEDVVEKLESISKITNELEKKQCDLAKDQSDFDRTRNKHSLKLLQLFPSQTVDKNFKNIVQKFNSDLQQEVNQIRTSLEKARISRNLFQTERDHLRNIQKSKEIDLKDIKEAIYNLCDGRDYLDLLASQKEKMDKLNMELAFHKSSESTLNHYVSDIDQDPCCPLCHKTLQSNESDDLKEEIHDKIRQLPSRINDTEQKLKEETEKFYKLNDYKSAYDNIEKLEIELKLLKEKLRKSEKNYNENADSLEDLELSKAEPESKLEMITATFIVDMCRLDDLAKNITMKTNEVAVLTSQLPREIPEKSLAEVKNELRQLNAAIKSKNEQIKFLTLQINTTHSKLNSLKEKLNEMVSSKVEHQEKVQGLDRLRNQIKDIEQQTKHLEQKINEDERSLNPIKEKLEELNQIKEKEKIEGQEKITKLQEKITELKMKQNEIDRFNADIEQYENMELKKKFDELMSQIEELRKNIESRQKDIELKSGEIKRLNDEVNNQEKNQRNLEDNIELQKTQHQQKKAEQNLADLIKWMGDLDVKKLINEKRELVGRQEKINNDRQVIRGQITESTDRIETAQKEVNMEKFRNAKTNYLKECYKESVLQTMIEDLHKYRSALERSLLKFHADKMSQINQTIRDLWNNIYRGNDIDYIAIKTDEEEMKSVSDKKRSYSYRVVQAKNGGSEMDMRGRCSAGQKVLASLIIRIALADSFSTSCGILALDEPTTNLDSNNIDSLCETLCQLVEEREKSGKFMLIVITHDMNFVKAMESAECYFKLHRDALGRSRIERIENQ